MTVAITTHEGRFPMRLFALLVLAAVLAAPLAGTLVIAVASH